MKVLLLNGSPKANGNTACLASHGCKAGRNRIDIYRLVGYFANFFAIVKGAKLYFCNLFGYGNLGKSGATLKGVYINGF